MGIDNPTIALAVAAIGGYLLGSIPWGLVLVRLAGLGDIRDIGSGNIGATNVLRTGNKPLAFLTLVLDTSKGGIAAWAAMQWAGYDAGLVAGLAAVLGHNFPVWLGFKGGKGVATTLGTLLAMSWPVCVAAGATWLLVAGTLRMSSAAGLIALTAAPLYAHWLVGNDNLVWTAAALAALSIMRHRANIGRILKGEEPKIGARKDDAAG